MAAMIEVLRLRIAGCTVGPVWFTERPDANFLRMMSSMTRGPVDGSLGGNALRGLRMTIDYPRALAWFTRVAEVSHATYRTRIRRDLRIDGQQQDALDGGLRDQDAVERIAVQ
ncbi:hypothetical protein B1B_06571, partial [mine drainage metagenome]